jgi:hypothetical protein
MADGSLKIGDGQEVVSRNALEQPRSLTFKARLVGAGCDQVFIGLKAEDGAGFSAPQAGFFIDAPGSVQALVAPETDSVPKSLATAPLPAALHRFRIDLEGGNVRFVLDGEVLVEKKPLVPRFSPAPLFMAIEVQDTCTVELEEWWSTSLPFDTPTLRTEDPVQFELY